MCGNGESDDYWDPDRDVLVDQSRVQSLRMLRTQEKEKEKEKWVGNGHIHPSILFTSLHFTSRKDDLICYI